MTGKVPKTHVICATEGERSETCVGCIREGRKSKKTHIVWVEEGPKTQVVCDREGLKTPIHT